MVSRRKAKRDEQSQTCKPYDKSRIDNPMVGYNDRLARVTNAAKRNDSSKPVKMQRSKKINIMNAKQLLKKANVVINSIIKHGRRADYIVTTKNGTEFNLNAGIGWNILKVKINANMPNGLMIRNEMVTPDNVRFGLTEEEVLSVLEIN